VIISFTEISEKKLEMIVSLNTA